MILYVEDLLREINIKNWYSGEALKRKEPDAVAVQSGADEQDAMMQHIRTAVNTVLLLANPNKIKFVCKYEDDKLSFSLSPIRVGREYLLDVLREAIRQFIVYEVRRLWMMLVRPEWADSSLRGELLRNISTAMGNVANDRRVRRRATDLAGI